MKRKNFARRAMHDVRVASEVAKARPAWAGGVRGAIATVTPIFVAKLFGIGGGAGTWMSLAGLNGAIIDRGGPYRWRAATMAALALGSAAIALVGTAVSGHLVLSVVVTFVVALFCGLLRAWVDVGTGFGVTLLLTYAVALAVPATTVTSALMRAVYLAIGGLWAMLIALVIWPLRPYRPVRIRVAACYRSIAELLTVGRSRSRGGNIMSARTIEPSEPPPGQTAEWAVDWAFPAERVALRTTIEAARTALAVSRRGRSGETKRGERLLMLHELADQLAVHVFALLEVLEESAPQLGPDTARALDETLGAVAASARSIANAVESEHDVDLVAVRWNGNALRRALSTERSADRSSGENMAALLDRMEDYAAAASNIVATLNSGDVEAHADDRVDIDELRAPPPAIFSFAAIVRPQSMVLHHALRVATMTTIGVLLTGLFHINHGHWMTLTIVVILQPYTGATTQKALQRVAGTVVGAMVAAIFTALFRSWTAIIVLIGLFTAACIALLPLNYGAYAVLGTPAFVLLAEVSASDWHLAGVRVVNTLIGGALALIGSRVLWPSDEWDRLPMYLAAALRANLDYLRVAIEMIARGRDANVGMLRAARRNIAIAASNADESFQRLVGEDSGPVEHLEPVMAFLVYTRRFAASTGALAIAGTIAPGTRRESLAPFEQAAGRVLDDLADAVETNRRPSAFPPIGAVPSLDGSMPPLIRARVNRLARQLNLLHAAIDRWAAARVRRAAEPGPISVRQTLS